MVTISLDLPYRLRPSEERALAETERGQGPLSASKVRRGLSEQFILGAANLNFPNGMTRAEAKIFGKIKGLLDREMSTIELDESVAEFLCDLFLTDEAQQRVRFRAEVSSWFVEWVAYLETVKASLNGATNASG